MINFLELGGWAGVSSILLGNFLLAQKRLDGRSKLYHTMNLGGSALIAVNAFSDTAYPSAALNLVWVVVAAYGIIRGFGIFKG